MDFDLCLNDRVRLDDKRFLITSSSGIRLKLFLVRCAEQYGPLHNTEAIGVSLPTLACHQRRRCRRAVVGRRSAEVEQNRCQRDPDSVFSSPFSQRSVIDDGLAYAIALRNEHRCSSDFFVGDSTELRHAGASLSITMDAVAFVVIEASDDVDDMDVGRTRMDIR